MKKIYKDSIVLPISKEIPFSYEGRLAFSLAATFGQEDIKDMVWEWIYSDFTQMICKREVKGRINHRFFHIYEPYNPFIQRKYKLRCKRLWKNPEKALNDVIKNISNGYYVHIRLDTYYIKALNIDKSPAIHSEHIYGYDNVKQILYLMRYDYSKGLYSINITFDEFRKAYTPLIGMSQQLFNVYDKVRKGKKYRLNSKRLCKKIVNYKESKIPLIDFVQTQFKVIPFAWDFPYGQSVGLSSIEYVKKLLNIELNNPNCYVEYGRYLSSRTRLQAIYEFKKLMYERLVFLLEHNIIRSCDESRLLVLKYKSISDAYLILRNMYLKYQITNDKSLLSSMLDRIDVLKVSEKEVLDLISKYFN